MIDGDSIEDIKSADDNILMIDTKGKLEVLVDTFVKKNERTNHEV